MVSGVSKGVSPLYRKALVTSVAGVFLFYLYNLPCAWYNMYRWTWVRGGSRGHLLSIGRSFVFFSCRGGARHFSVGRLSIYLRRVGSLPAAHCQLRIVPKCKICTSNYTLTITTGENTPPPLLSKSAYDFQDRFIAAFFIFKKIFLLRRITPPQARVSNLTIWV